MYSYIEHNWGCDADGNRGIDTTFYEIDEDDAPEIESQILEHIQSSGELPNTAFMVYLISPNNEEAVEFEINPFEYIDKPACLEYLAEHFEDSPISFIKGAP